MELITPSQYLEYRESLPLAVPNSGSWLDGSFGARWLNCGNDWVASVTALAANRLDKMADLEDPDPLMVDNTNQALRELMLAQACDWPLLLSTGQHAQTARKKLRNHLVAFHKLYEDFSQGRVDPESLRNLRQRTPIFAHLDYRPIFQSERYQDMPTSPSAPPQPILNELWHLKESSQKLLELCQSALADPSSQELRQAHVADPQNTNTLNNLGLCLLRQGQLEEAISTLKCVLNLKPQDELAHTNLAFALTYRQDLEGAIEHYRAALQVNPRNSYAWRNLGQCCVQRGELSAAIEAFTKTLELEPQDADTYNGLGLAYLADGQLAPAIMALDQALDLRPQDKFTYNNKGLVYTSLGQLNNALASFRAALQLDPKDECARLNMGIALARQNKLDQAMECWGEVLSQHPQNREAQLNIGLGYFEKGLFQQAAHTLESMLPNALETEKPLLEKYLHLSLDHLRQPQ